MTLTNETFIVTGSYSGIGFASAHEIVKQEGNVILTSTEQNASALCEACAALGAEKACWITADLDEPQAPQRIVEFARSRFGHIDGLVNNAAYFPRNDLKSITTDVFDKMMAVNVRAP